VRLSRTLPSVSSERNNYETHPGPSAFPCGQRVLLTACWMSKGRESPGRMPFSMPSAFANCPSARCALTLMTCCTSPAGLRTHTGLCPTSASPPCWTTSVTNWTNSRSQRRKPSIIAWVWCVAYIASTMDERFPPGQSHFQRIYTKRSSLGFGRPHRAAALAACGVTRQIQRWQVGPRWHCGILVGRSGKREVLVNAAEFTCKALLDQRMTKISRLGRLRSSRGVPAPKVCRNIRLKLNAPT
jgi:hypothetical protein